jgi:outer membrane receptor for ferric coprogen and ferric-rhodotorulic acid
MAIHPTFQVDFKDTTVRLAFDYIDLTTGAAQNFVLPDGQVYTGAGRDEQYQAKGVMEDHTQIRERATLLHRFSPNWEAKLHVTHIDYERQGSVLLPNNLDLVNQRLGLRARRNFQRFDNWIVNQDFLGNYKIGSLANQSALGFTLTDEINRAAFTNSTTFGVQQVPIANPQMDRIAVPSYASYTPVHTTGSWTNNRRSTYYYQHQIEAIPERLTFVAGATYAALQVNDVPAIEQRNAAGGTRVVNYEEWLHRYGAVFNITKEIALYALESTTFAPQSNSNTRDINGALLPAQDGKGQEVGLKTALFGGKLSTTVSYFDLELTNVAIVAGAPSPVTGQPYFIPVGIQRQKGWDGMIAYAPIPAWQIFLTAYRGTVKDQDGATVNNSYKTLYSFFTRYEFGTGALKGLSIGGGGSKTGGNIFTQLGNYTFPVGTTPGPITLESVWNMNAFASYKRGKHWSFRLNLENLLDKTYALGGQTVLLTDMSPPRTWQVSTTYRF